MIWKRTVFAVGYVALILGLAFGNGSEEVSKGQENQVMTVSIMAFRDILGVDCYVGQELPALIKQKTGMDVVFDEIVLGSHNGAEWNQKLAIMMASGEKPADVMTLTGESTGELYKGGWLAELNMELLKEACPQYVAEVNTRFPDLWFYGSDISTGNMMAIPTYNMYGPTRQTFLYRGDWLKKFGMSPPETLDEFEQWLRKVRFDDPDGNGQNDTYGYTAEAYGNNPGFHEIFGAFGVIPGQWSEKNGKVYRDDIQPQVKEGLAVLRKWYADDLLPKGIMTTAKNRQDFYSGITGTYVLAYAPAIPEGGYIHANTKHIEGVELLAALPPKGPDGTFMAWEYGPKKYQVCFGKHLEGTDKLKRVIGMLEAVALDKEMFEISMLGKQGIHWDWAPGGGTIFLPPYDDFNKRVEEVGVRDLSESAFQPFWFERMYTDYLHPEAVEYAKMIPGKWDLFIGVPLPSDKDYAEELNNLTKEVYYQIITGEKPLDAFDAYVDKWKSSGGDQWAAEAQRVYTDVLSQYMQ